MNKSELIEECKNLFERANDPSILIEGAGEFLEGTVGDLIPYLNKEGLKFLKEQLSLLLSKN